MRRGKKSLLLASVKSVVSDIKISQKGGVLGTPPKGLWNIPIGTRSPHYPTDFIVLSGFVQKQVRIDSNAN